MKKFTSSFNRMDTYLQRLVIQSEEQTLPNLTIYTATNKAKEELVRIKRYSYSVENSGSESFASQVLRDLLYLKSLSFVSLLPCFYVSMSQYNDKNEIIIVSQQTKNGTLDNVIKSGTLIDDTSKMIIIYGLLQGLREIHSRGLVYGDLNPRTILLDDNFHPYIDLVNLYDENNNQDFTLFYDKSINQKDPKADVFSFGALIYFLLEDDKKEIESKFPKRVLSGKVPIFGDNFPEIFKPIISKCLEKNQKDRPSFDEIFKIIDCDMTLPGTDKNVFEEYKNKFRKEDKNEDKKRKIDRYGWFQEDVQLSKKESKISEKENIKEYQRSLKWAKMLSNWNVYKQQQSKIIKKVKKGIPDSIRSRAWYLLVDGDYYKSEYPEKMSDLLQKEKHDSYSTIEKDIIRTFQQVSFLSDPKVFDSLRKVLYCYSQIDPELGYTQGMSFIAGMFVLYMDEESAFYSFISVMLGKKINQRGYLCPGFPRLHQSNQVLSKLLKHKAPNILKKLEKANIALHMFTTDWFFTAFMVYKWVPEFQLRIFEHYLLYGIRFLISFSLQILLVHQDEILSGTLESILPILQHPDKSKKITNWHVFLNYVDSNLLSEKEYDALEKAASKAVP